MPTASAPALGGPSWVEFLGGTAPALDEPSFCLIPTLLTTLADASWLASAPEVPALADASWLASAPEAPALADASRQVTPDATIPDFGAPSRQVTPDATIPDFGAPSHLPIPGVVVPAVATPSRQVAAGAVDGASASVSMAAFPGLLPYVAPGATANVAVTAPAPVLGFVLIPAATGQVSARGWAAAWVPTATVTTAASVPTLRGVNHWPTASVTTAANPPGLVYRWHAPTAAVNAHGWTSVAGSTAHANVTATPGTPKTADVTWETATVAVTSANPHRIGRATCATAPVDVTSPTPTPRLVTWLSADLSGAGAIGQREQEIRTSAATSNATIAAHPPALLIDPARSLLSATAALFAGNPQPPSTKITGGEVSVDAATMWLRATANGGPLITGTGTTAGDTLDYPVWLRGPGGAWSPRFGPVVTWQTDLQADAAVTWAAYLAQQPCAFTAWCAPAGVDYSVDVFTGQGGDPILVSTTAVAAAATTDTRIDLAPPVGDPMWVRARFPAAINLTGVTVTWAVTPAAGAVFTAPGAVERTPTSVTVAGLNYTPGEMITVTLGTVTLGTFTADTTGCLASATLDLPELPVGTHTLRGTGARSGRVGEMAMTVANQPIPTPQPAAPDVDPIPPVAVNKWVFQDPAGELAAHVFIANPEAMTSPHAPRSFLADTTTAPDGTVMLWEGGRKAYEWKFNGKFWDKTTHDAFVSYAKLNRRFYVIDHRRRAWIVIFSQLDMTPIRFMGQPWAHQYAVTALVFRGPITI